MSSQQAKPGKGGGTAASQEGGQLPGMAEALEPGLEATVAGYLSSHHDFFERNPEVLALLQVPHGHGGAVSLIEHQVKVLRRQLETERARLTHLITRAREYESLSTRLHGLVLQIIPVTDLQALGDALQDALRREFSAEAVTLRLFPLDPSAVAGADPLAHAFRGFLDREHALCGPLDSDKRLVLFGESGAEVRSAALVPIRAEGRSGVLAIGAADPERFKPDMGTDLLDRLGEIVGHKLRTLSPGTPRKPSRKPAARSAPGPDGKPAPRSARKSGVKTSRSSTAGKPSSAGASGTGLDEAPEANAGAQSD
jgi:uncharacterized protein